MAKGRSAAELWGFYREAPFWSWNDRMEVDEALRQIDLMAEGGWGGFFMHARVGIATPYMGPQWMKVVKACVERARDKGMCAYLYDEDKWPSGFAGGKVPSKGPRYRSKHLVLSENLVEKDERYELLASFVTEGEGGVIEAVAAGGRAPAGRTIYHLYKFTNGLGNEWFRDTSYVDLMDPEVTDEFLRVTHEPYRKAVGEQFGKAVPGMFTDEPCVTSQAWGPGRSVPWTTRMEEEFSARRGYDITPHLLSLFLPAGDYRKVRYDFYRTVTELFVENYMKRVYDWCGQNGIAYTGHVMAEDTISSQIEWVGAAMPCYEYMHFPGMDHLCFNVSNPQTAKQVSSAADQLAKPRALSELYGVSGQDFNFKGRKWIADWHLALGINLLNPHLWLYTMRGERKRDYPPTISYQQPHWLKSHAMSDRNASLSKVLSHGARVVDVLVIHAVESGWCDATPLEPAALSGLDATFAQVVDTLLAAHLDFHFGDESLMATYGSVEDGRLAVGMGRYDVVVVPDCLTLRQETVRLLDEFAGAGGKVIVVNRRPRLVDGSAALASLYRRALRGVPVVAIGDLARAARKASRPRVEITGRNAGKVIYHLREIAEGRFAIFVANTDYDRSASVRVKVRGVPRYAGLADLSSGDPDVADLKCARMAARRAVDATVFRLELAEAGSALVAFAESQWPEAPAAPTPRRGREIALGGPWRVAAMDENALTLDYVRVPDESNAWSGQQYVLFAGDQMRQAGGEARARYEFAVDALPAGPVHLVIERPERWKVTLNGKRVPSRPRGYFVDTSFKRLDITGLVREGRNVVEIAGEVKEDFELESAYIVGRFGTWRFGARRPQLAALGGEAAEKYYIAAAPETVSAADLSGEGMAFFAGAVGIEREVELSKAPQAAALRLAGLFAGAAEVSVNGKPQGDLLWPPYELPLTGLKAGRNLITLKLLSTLRNLLGPHHFEGPEIEWVGPAAFVNRKLWTDTYRLRAFGISGARLVVS